jgi:hypothetical protein
MTPEPTNTVVSVAVALVTFAAGSYGFILGRYGVHTHPTSVYLTHYDGQPVARCEGLYSEPRIAVLP